MAGCGSGRFKAGLTWTDWISQTCTTAHMQTHTDTHTFICEWLGSHVFSCWQFAPFYFCTFQIELKLSWDSHSFLTSVHTVMFILLFLWQYQFPFLGLVRILPDKQTPEAFTSPPPSHRLTNGHNGDHCPNTSNSDSFLTPCHSVLNSRAARSVNSQFNWKSWCTCFEFQCV